MEQRKDRRENSHWEGETYNRPEKAPEGLVEDGEVAGGRQQRRSED